MTKARLKTQLANINDQIAKTEDRIKKAQGGLFPNVNMLCPHKGVVDEFGDIVNEGYETIIISDNLGKLSEKEQLFLSKAKQIAELVIKKNRAYGDSFAKTGAFLKLLYPDGIKSEQYDDMLALVRTFDKQMRIATDKDALGENPWQDVNGYSLLAVVMDELKKQKGETK